MHAFIIANPSKGNINNPFRVENSSRSKLCEFKTLADSQLSISKRFYCSRATAWGLRSKPFPSLRSMDPASHEATIKEEKKAG